MILPARRMILTNRLCASFRGTGRTVDLCSQTAGTFPRMSGSTVERHRLLAPTAGDLGREQIVSFSCL
jgi:hypothetical protein